MTEDDNLLQDNGIAKASPPLYERAIAPKSIQDASKLLGRLIARCLKGELAVNDLTRIAYVLKVFVDLEKESVEERSRERIAKICGEV